MSSIFDQIANVTIGIESSIKDSVSYDKILIIGALPSVAPATAPAQMGYYESLAEVTSAGWVASGSGADPVGIAAAVAFAQNPKPSGIYIAPIQVTSTTVNSETVTTPETAATTAARAIETEGWFVCCPVGLDSTNLAGLAAFIETKEKMMLYTETAFFGNSDTAAIGATYTRSAGIFGKESSAQADADIPVKNKYGMAVAFAVSWLSYPAGSETAAYKKMIDVKPAKLISTERAALNSACLTYYTTVGNVDVTIGGKVMAGEWMDVIRFRDWLKNDMSQRVVALFLANPKVPFTDAGIALVHNAVESSLKAGQEAGGIVPDEYDEDGNETLGFEVSVPTATSVSSENKMARILPDIMFRAHLSGAIHVTTITGTLAYSL